MRDCQGNPIAISTRLSLTDAHTAVEGETYDVLQAPPAADYASPAGVTAPRAPLSDGSTLAAIMPSQRDLGDAPTPQDTPGLFSDVFRPLTDMPKAPDGIARSFSGSDARGLTMAWSESSGDNLYYAEWVVCAAESPKYKPVLLAQSSDIVPGGTLALYGYATAPTLGENTTYWATSYPVGPLDTDGLAADYSSKVQGRATDGSSPVYDVADYAYQPAADGRYVYYLRNNWVDPSADPGQYRIYRRAGTEPEELFLTGDQGIARAANGLSAQGGTITWVVAGSRPGAKAYSGTQSTSDQAAGCAIIYLLDTATMNLTAIDIDSDAGLDPRSTGGAPLAAWDLTNPDGDLSTYVYDSTTASLWLLTTATIDSWPAINEDRILWFTSDPDSDTTVIPHNSKWHVGA